MSLFGPAGKTSDESRLEAMSSNPGKDRQLLSVEIITNNYHRIAGPFLCFPRKTRQTPLRSRLSFVRRCKANDGH